MNSITTIIMALNHCLSTSNQTLIAIAQELASHNNLMLKVIVVGKYANDYEQELQKLKINEIHLYQTNEEVYVSDTYSKYLITILDQITFKYALFNSDDVSKSLASSLAIYYQAGLSADCMDIYFKDEQLIQVRPAYSGNVQASIIGVLNHKNFVSINTLVFNKQLVLDESK
ncbi:MAG: hypothetical protein ACRCTA_04175, partial [Bacilli bacterium]